MNWDVELEIMNYCNEKKKVVIKNFSNVIKMSIEVISGDEILHVLREDYSEETFDSSNDRMMEFFDNEYTLYDKTRNIDYIDKWNKRKNSYDFNEEV